MTEHNDAEDIMHGLSAVLGESARFASPEIVEQRVLGALAQLTPTEADSFTAALGSVGRFVKNSGLRDAAGAALPVVGTAVGTAFGGPVGAAVGGGLGTAAGQAIAGAPRVQRTQPPAPARSYEDPRLRPVPPAVSVGTAVQPTPVRSAAETGSAAAAQLLSVIQNPALLSSILALIMGASGRTSVPVGRDGVEAPVGALMNVLGVLAHRAAQDADEILAARQNETPMYLLDEHGCLTCDPAVPSQRADALLRVLTAEPPGGADEAGPYGFDEFADDWAMDDWW